MEHFFNLSMDMFCIAGFDGYFKELNPAWTTFTGYKRNELLDTQIMDLIHSDDIRETMDGFSSINEENKYCQIINRFRYKDGLYHWLKWNATVSEENNMIYAVARDITQERYAQKLVNDLNKELEERVSERTRDLEEINKELESFSYSVSHDLRAPLRAISGYSNYLLEDFGPELNDEAIRLINIIVSEAEHMGELIDSLLKFSRMGRQVASTNRIDMVNLASEVWKTLQYSYDIRNIKFNIHNLPPATGDRSMIRQVFQNLLTNAIKYRRFDNSADQHIIEILYEPGKNQNIYAVKDNGIGFDMRYYDKLFGVFQRLHSDPQYSGDGIGLALVKRIIAKHGGQIWAEGEVGQGATFYFSLPK